MAQRRSYTAGEDIGPSLFVVLGDDPHEVLVAGAGEEAIGVSHEGTRTAPLPGITPLHAASGEAVLVYGLGEGCEVLCGAAISMPAFIKSDANGKAVAASSTENYIAEAVSETTAADQKLKINLVRGVTP